MADSSVKRDRSDPVPTSGAALTRRRLNGRTKLQQEQKDSSRERLLSSAGRLYSELSYMATTVDDIVKDAQVSRTTFYRHFDSKLAIAEALFAQTMVPITAIHEELASHDDPSEKEIALWINQLIDHLQVHKTLVRTMREVEATEPDSAQNDTHRRLIQLYGRRIAAFRAASSDAAKHAEVRMRAKLLMLLFDQFFYSTAVRGNIDRALGVKIMAGEMRRFIVDFRGKPAGRAKS